MPAVYTTNTVPSHLTREVRLIPFDSGEGGVQTNRAVILLGGSHGPVPVLFKLQTEEGRGQRGNTEIP